MVLSFLLCMTKGFEGETVQSGLPVDVRDRGRPSAQFARESNPFFSAKKMLNTHTGVEHFFFWRSRKGFFTSAPQLSKRATAQITKQSRVGKLACQRGARRLLRERCDNVATKHEVLNAERLRLARSKVQIKSTPSEPRKKEYHSRYSVFFSAKHKPQFRYKGIAFFVFMWYNNIVIISYDEGRILYGKTIFMDNEHRRKHTVLS